MVPLPQKMESLFENLTGTCCVFVLGLLQYDHSLFLFLFSFSAWIHGGRKREFGLFCSEVIFTFHVRSSILPLHGQGRRMSIKMN